MMKHARITMPLMVSVILIALPGAYATGNISNGKIIFTKSCLGCHGETGEGNGPAANSFKPKPANFVSPSYKDSIDKNPVDYSDTELENIVSNGRTGTAMPAWKKGLTPSQISDVVVYIRSLHATKVGHINE